MQLDIKKAINCIFEDENWLKKYLIIMLVAESALIPILGLISSFALVSYWLILVNRKIFRPKTAFCELDIEEAIYTGFKLIGFTICVFIITGITGIIISALSGALLASKAIFLIIIAVLFSMVFFILISVYADLATLIFMTNLKFKTFFNFKAIKHILKNCFGGYVKVSLYKFGLFMIPGILIGANAFSGIDMNSVATSSNPGLSNLKIYISLSFINLFTPFIGLIVADLNAQFIRQAFKIGTKTQPQG